MATKTITATGLSLARLDVGEYGTEVWLCERPAAAEEALAAGPDKAEAARGDGDCGLDLAAGAAGQCVVLRAHWGNDIPAENEEWLAGVLARTVPADREEVAALVRADWLATERRVMARRGLLPL